MNYKYPKSADKQDILNAINILIVFCRINEPSTIFLLEQLESALIHLEENLK